AAGVPCVMTKISAEGLELPAELEWLVADEPEVLVDRIQTLCFDDDRHHRIAEACRSHIAANYSADRIDSQLRQACGLQWTSRKDAGALSAATALFGGDR